MARVENSFVVVLWALVQTVPTSLAVSHLKTMNKNLVRFSAITWKQLGCSNGNIQIKSVTEQHNAKLKLIITLPSLWQILCGLFTEWYPKLWQSLVCDRVIIMQRSVLVLSPGLHMVVCTEQEPSLVRDLNEYGFIYRLWHINPAVLWRKVPLGWSGQHDRLKGWCAMTDEPHFLCCGSEAAQGNCFQFVNTSEIVLLLKWLWFDKSISWLP